MASALQSRLVMAIVLALLIPVSAAAIYYSPRAFQPHTHAIISFVNNCTRPTGYFLVVADSAGFNDSASHGAPENPWPTISVVKGETVNLLVCNQDPVQPHGFVIDHYFVEGVNMNPGNAYRISFVADTTGVFRIYCYVFCTVHRVMFGKLLITS